MGQKIALVTGASQGIGRQIALTLAQNGIDVIIHFHRSESKAQTLSNEILAMGRRAWMVQADVSKPSEIIKMFDDISNFTDCIDYVINNAGIDNPQKFEDFSFENWQRIINVNLNGKFFVLHSAIKFLKKSESPRVVNISSRLAWKVLETASAYGCSQAGIIMLTKYAALELSKYGIRVNAVCPSMTKTAMMETLYPSEDTWIKFSQSNPLGRVAQPNDIAGAVMFLLSPQADFIDGTHILVDGGNSLK